MVWTTIPNSDLSPDKPLKTSLMKSLRDNVPAVANADSGAPNIASSAVYDKEIGSVLLLSDGVYSSGTYTLPNLHVWNDFRKLVLITVKGYGTPSTDGVETITATRDYFIDQSPTSFSLTSKQATNLGGSYSYIVYDSSTSFTVGSAGTGRVRQLIGWIA